MPYCEKCNELLKPELYNVNINDVTLIIDPENKLLTTDWQL